MIDISSIKPGDKVTVELDVYAIAAEKNFLTVASPRDLTLNVPLHLVRSHTPAPREIKVGDRVLLGGKGSSLYGGAPYEVKHLDGHLAWIYVSLEHTLRNIDELSHAPPPR